MRRMGINQRTIIVRQLLQIASDFAHVIATFPSRVSNDRRNDTDAQLAVLMEVLSILGNVPQRVPQ